MNRAARVQCGLVIDFAAEATKKVTTAMIEVEETSETDRQYKVLKLQGAERDLKEALVSVQMALSTLT